MCNGMSLNSVTPDTDEAVLRAMRYISAGGMYMMVFGIYSIYAGFRGLMNADDNEYTDKLKTLGMIYISFCILNIIIIFIISDTVTALRASELEADAILFAKAIDGVYDSDPAVNPNAVKFDEIPCKDIVEKNLKVIDIAAANLCYEQKIPVVIFGLAEEKSVIRAANGEKIGTTVTV